MRFCSYTPTYMLRKNTRGLISRVTCSGIGEPTDLLVQSSSGIHTHSREAVQTKPSLSNDESVCPKQAHKKFMDHAEELYKGGLFNEALEHLNLAKGTHGSNCGIVDYYRGLCYLKLKDPLHARQALLEELRLKEDNEDARDLLHRVELTLKKSIELPREIIDCDPLFAMIYDSLKGHSMLHWPRLFALYSHAKQICEDNVPGDFIECGVAGGGSTVIMAIVAKHYSTIPRRVYACDVFRGMPMPTEEDTTDDTHNKSHKGKVSALSPKDCSWGAGTCSGSEECVKRLAANFEVEVETVPGLFQDTLPHIIMNNHQIAFSLIHLDSDWYLSIKTCIEELYPLLSCDGVLQIDDYYYWDGCQLAVKEYLESNSIQTSCLHDIDKNAVWMRKK
eukprot:Tbor_TRINITY_DN3424_c0_g1::TRINITY_DN3424_c0_g1_i1::g.3644::m.3644